jgi:N-acetylglucosaminyl-diphospho-decaprenol L-rhamnosyltransferase
MATVLTVILNWRSADMTLQATKSAVDAMAAIDGDIVVVDNDSRDGSFEQMTAHVAESGWSRVRVIQSGRNGGFGAGNNVGFRAGLRDGSRPDYVFILNSDAFPEADAIRILRDYLDSHPEAGFAGSCLHGPDTDRPDGDLHQTAFRFPSIPSEFEGAARIGPISRLFKRHILSLPVPEETMAVDWLAGAAMMIRRSVLDEIGMFDETFFLYFEETDLCRRGALRGHQTHYVRESVVTHIGSVSTGMKSWSRVPDYWYDSRLHYFIKNHGRLYAGAATIAHLSGGGLHRLRCLLTGQRRTDPPRYLRTMAAHGLRAMFAPRPANVANLPVTAE